MLNLKLFTLNIGSYSTCTRWSCYSEHVNATFRLSEQIYTGSIKDLHCTYTVALVLALASDARDINAIWSWRTPLPTVREGNEPTALLVVDGSMAVTARTSLDKCWMSRQHGDSPAVTAKLRPAGSWAEAAGVCCLHALCGNYKHAEGWYVVRRLVAVSGPGGTGAGCPQGTLNWRHQGAPSVLLPELRLTSVLPLCVSLTLRR